MGKYIAERMLRFKYPDNRLVEVKLSIGLPYKNDDISWSCPVTLEGLHDKVHDIVGADSFQALMLAQNLARTLLLNVVDKGVKIYSLEDNNENHEIEINKLFQEGI